MYHVISLCTLYVNKCTKFMYLVCNLCNVCTLCLVYGVYVPCM